MSYVRGQGALGDLPSCADIFTADLCTGPDGNTYQGSQAWQSQTNQPEVAGGGAISAPPSSSGPKPVPVSSGSGQPGTAPTPQRSVIDRLKEVPTSTLVSLGVIGAVGLLFLTKKRKRKGSMR